MNRKIRQFIGWILCIALLFAFVCAPSQTVYGAGDEYSAEEVYQAALRIVDWAAPEGVLFSDDFCAGAGSSGNDWLAIGYCRLWPDADATAYLQALQLYVGEMYAKGNLENQKPTQWHRISLAVLAAGGEPERFGTAPDGSAIDLIADGTYDHEKFSPLGRQGLNGWCFALLAMDGAEAVVPEDASYSREEIITHILEGQLSDGAFSLTGGTPDVDITAMAVQALAAYDDEETAFTFENSGKTVTETVHEALDRALSWLSAAQLSDGDFSSYGIPNAESTAQVLLALTAMGIDVQNDARFIKDGNTALDGLMRYQMEDGGFAHVLDHASSKSNGLASAQSLCALASVYRQMKNMPAFYCFEYNAGGKDGQTQTSEQETVSGTETGADISAQETLSPVPEQEMKQSGYLVYGIAAVVIILGIVSCLVMKKIGKEDS